ncbi:outer membrane protein OmpK [Stutzerimonas stutzeri]|uniref:outer membrane protein OmpK n=1 Tax=Stutzerimonas stutzeri TaxID=316 RepID=UPI001C2E6BFD|nr:outer membrane protein OmpK [Stutzerimonas stutzeri]
MKTTLAATLMAGITLAGETLADNALLWQDNSISYLYGKNFSVDAGDIQQTLTFEHASGWAWGDVFLFVDNKWYNGLNGDAGHTYYGEFAPRLSLGKVSGRDLSLGPIKDVLIAAQYERGESSDAGQANQAYLLGPGFDLAIPGFDRVALNIYYRKPDGIRGKASGQWQVTPVWAMTFPVGTSEILFDGYFDWAVNDVGKKGTPNYVSRNFQFNPQLKYDVGRAMHLAPRTFYVGIEYLYWSNKYGIRDSSAFNTDNNTTSLLFKAHF